MLSVPDKHAVFIILLGKHDCSLLSVSFKVACDTDIVGR